MNKINVIDLDKTLIPFDSFRYLLLAYLKDKNFLTIVSLYVFAREIRLVKSEAFKRQCLIHLRKDKQYQKMINDLLGKIISATRHEIMNMINSETDQETINVLVSASPIDYVGLVAMELGWQWLASDLVNGQFIHCHGQKKKELVLLHYPSEKFEYNFAISDSVSDLPLLEMFKRHKLII